MLDIVGLHRQKFSCNTSVSKRHSSTNTFIFSKSWVKKRLSVKAQSIVEIITFSCPQACRHYFSLRCTNDLIAVSVQIWSSGTLCNLWCWTPNQLTFRFGHTQSDNRERDSHRLVCLFLCENLLDFHRWFIVPPGWSSSSAWTQLQLSPLSLQLSLQLYISRCICEEC